MEERILILQPYLAPYRIDVYNYLSKYIDIKLLFWFNEAPEQKFNLEVLKQKCSFKFAYLKGGFVVKNRIIKFDIINQIIRYKPTHIICHEFGFFTIMSLILSKFLRFKVIVNTDDNLEMLETVNGTRKYLQSICFKRVSGLITTNPSSLDYITSRFPRLEGHAIYYPILQDEFSLRKELVQSLEISQKYLDFYKLNGKKVFLYVGRLAEEKRIDILISAFNDLVAIKPDIVLIIVGSGPSEKKLKEIVTHFKLNNKINFTGRTDGKELYAWYNIGQIFVLPSRFETFGAVVNEALISGNFVVTSNKVGSEFLIEKNNGIIFKSGDVDSLVNALKVLIEKISPIGKQIIIKKSKSVHSFDYFTNNLKDFLIKTF